MHNDKKYPQVIIIILNWNSWQDTIECLESLYKSDYPNFHVILIDNDSQDDSISKIRDWSQGRFTSKINTKFPELIFPEFTKPVTLLEVDVSGNSPETISDIPGGKIRNRSLIFIKNHENSGFARANNIAVNFSRKFLQCEYYYLLNNDTVISPDALSNIVNIFETRKSIGAGVSTIYYYDDYKTIELAGGRLNFLARVKNYTTIIENLPYRSITFVNGCAMLIRSSVITNEQLFSDRFFFGEEDVDFSWRLKMKNIKMICAYDSKVYHKVSKSAKTYFENRSKKVFLYGFNRLVNMKFYFNPIIWRLWKLLVLIYFFYLFMYRAKLSVGKSIKMVYYLNVFSVKHDNVHRNTLLEVYNQIKL